MKTKKNNNRIILFLTLGILYLFIPQKIKAQTVLESSQIDSIQFLWIYKDIDFNYSILNESDFIKHVQGITVLKTKNRIKRFIKIVENLKEPDFLFQRDYKILILIRLKDKDEIKMMYSYYNNEFGILDYCGVSKYGGRTLNRFFDKLLYKNYISPVPKITKKMIRKENNN